MSPGTGFHISGSRTLAETGFLTVEEVDLETPDSGTGKRTVVRLGGAVGIVALTDDHVVLIRQYRTPVDKPILELPAGKLDVPGEDPLETAKRELEEEAGFVAANYELLAQFFTSPGFSDEQMTIYLATDLTRTTASPMGPEELASELVFIPVREIPSILPDVEDGKTLVGLMSLLLRLGKGAR